MEIKTLNAHIQEFKRLRNLIELEYDNLMDEGKKITQEADNQDRCGLIYECPIDTEGLNDGAHSISYGLKQINEGIAFLESAYRRAVRFKKEKSEDAKKEEDKKST